MPRTASSHPQVAGKAKAGRFRGRCVLHSPHTAAGSPSSTPHESSFRTLDGEQPAEGSLGGDGRWVHNDAGLITTVMVRVSGAVVLVRTLVTLMAARVVTMHEPTSLTWVQCCWRRMN